jgi:hypothetical protein
MLAFSHLTFHTLAFPFTAAVQLQLSGLLCPPSNDRISIAAPRFDRTIAGRPPRFTVPSVFLISNEKDRKSQSAATGADRRVSPHARIVAMMIYHSFTKPIRSGLPNGAGNTRPDASPALNQSICIQRTVRASLSKDWGWMLPPAFFSAAMTEY